MSNKREYTKKLKITFINENETIEELLKIAIIEKLKNSDKYHHTVQ